MAVGSGLAFCLFGGVAAGTEQGDEGAAPRIVPEAGHRAIFGTVAPHALVGYAEAQAGSSISHVD